MQTSVVSEKMLRRPLFFFTFLDKPYEHSDSDSQKQLWGLYIDIRKAFDIGPYDTLIVKLLSLVSLESCWILFAENVAVFTEIK